MPLSGVVISCRPECVTALSESLGQPGVVEIHGIAPNSKLVAVVEADSVEKEVEVVTQLLATDGVVDVQLVYHNFEDISL